MADMTARQADAISYCDPNLQYVLTVARRCREWTTERLASGWQGTVLQGADAISAKGLLGALFWLVRDEPGPCRTWTWSH